MKKKITLCAIATIAVFVFFYAVFGFVMDDYDTTNWGIQNRTLYAFFTCSISAFLCMGIAFNEYDDGWLG